jgi:pheromone shutdown-related protein TraB
MDEKSNVSRLVYKDKEIVLIATAHVSKESAELVKQVISEERPDSVCIELDEERFKSIQNPKAWENTDLVKVIKTHKVGFLVANLFLGSYQKKIAKKLDTRVGGEIVQAIESAGEIGAELVLADRSIQTTFLRIWRKLGAKGKMKLLFSLLFSSDDDNEITDKDIQELLREDMLESVMASVKKQFPEIGEILISERDRYLASKIKNAPGNKVVAILGGAHVPGVREEIFKEQDIGEISSIPPKSRFSKIAVYIIPAIIAGLLVYAFTQGIQTGLKQVSEWVIWTGLLSALFTALSLGHPLSILTSLIAAPFTTLHPLLASGWVVGLVEATIKKPTVRDVQNIQTDILSFKGFFKNRFLKTILIIFMTNIGASLGTFIAGADIIKNLI